MARVKGRVTYQGKPVPKGTITFQATAPEGRNATGQIDPDGYYTLQTEEPGDGALVGSYLVAISARDEAVLDYIPKKPIPPKFLVPAMYEDPAKSGLKRAIPRGGGYDGLRTDRMRAPVAPRREFSPPSQENLNSREPPLRLSCLTGEHRKGRPPRGAFSSNHPTRPGTSPRSARLDGPARVDPWALTPFQVGRRGLPTEFSRPDRREVGPAPPSGLPAGRRLQPAQPGRK